MPASRTKFRILWLILERSGIDVCLKDPGFAVDLIFRGDMRDVVAVYLGYVEWRDLARKKLLIEGDPRLAAQGLRLDKVVGRDFPALPSAA